MAPELTAWIYGSIMLIHFTTKAVTLQRIVANLRGDFGGIHRHAPVNCKLAEAYPVLINIYRSVQTTCYDRAPGEAIRWILK